MCRGGRPRASAPVARGALGWVVWEVMAPLDSHPLPYTTESDERLPLPAADHWMLTIAILAVIICCAAMPSPLMVIAGMLSLCYLAPSDILPAMLAIGALLSLALLMLI